jgi:hypothetical protein
VLYVYKCSCNKNSRININLTGPDAAAAAIDVVMQYAVHELHFHPQDIIIHAWYVHLYCNYNCTNKLCRSIGGFTATWASMQYADLGGLVLDATFDDVCPLAEGVMPASVRPLVTATIRRCGLRLFVMIGITCNYYL